MGSEVDIGFSDSRESVEDTREREAGAAEAGRGAMCESREVLGGDGDVFACPDFPRAVIVRGLLCFIRGKKFDRGFFLCCVSSRICSRSLLTGLAEAGANSTSG